jgi:ribosomal protein S18 acetylase RimI-like enzyme
MEFRTLSSLHAEEFFQLRLAGLVECPQAFGESADEFRNKGSEAVAVALTNAEEAGSFVLGTFLSLKLAGVVGLRRQTAEKQRHIGWVWGLYVLPDFRQSGIAKALLTELLLRCRGDGGLEQLRLAVEANNHAAIRLYAAFGFRSFGRESRAIKIGPNYFDEEHMLLQL